MDALIPPSNLQTCCRQMLAAAEVEWLAERKGTAVREPWTRLVSTASGAAPGLLDHLDGLGRLCVASVPGFLDAARVRRTCLACGRESALIVVSAKLMAYGLQMGVALANAIVGTTERGCAIDTESTGLGESVRRAADAFFSTTDSVAWMSDLHSEVRKALRNPAARPVLTAISHGELWLCCHEMAHAFPCSDDEPSLVALVAELSARSDVREPRARRWAHEIRADIVGLSMLSARLHGFALSVERANGWRHSPTEVTVHSNEEAVLGATCGLLMLEGLERTQDGYGRSTAKLYFSHPPASLRRRELLDSRRGFAKLFGKSVTEPAEMFERIWLATLANAHQPPSAGGPNR